MTRRLAFLAPIVLVVVAALAIARLLLGGTPAAPDFTLTDQDGRPFTLSAQRGHAVALFFGYTHCPDVCPTTLAALARARRTLGSAADRFEVVFVTVDPARDDVPTLRRYVRLFDPSFVGLTGSAAQLEPVYAAYHIVHERDPGRGGAYTMTHSSVVEFIGRDGRLRTTGDWSDPPATLAAAMRRALT